MNTILYSFNLSQAMTNQQFRREYSIYNEHDGSGKSNFQNFLLSHGSGLNLK